MKKIIFSALILSSSLSSFAQTKWDLNGNSISSSNFIGTTNNEALVLKANNIIGLKVKPNGELLFKSLDLNSSSGPNGLVITDGQGVVSRFNFLTNANKVLYSDGTWGLLPAGSNLWQDGSGSKIYYNGKVGINNSNPAYQLDVTGDARISNNLYVGGGILITRKVEASASLKTDTIHSMSGETKFTSKVILKNQFQVDGTTLFNGTVQANNLYVNGNTNFASRITIPQGLTFDGLKGISYTPATGNSPLKIHYGSKILDIPESCAAAPQAWANHQFGGMVQIFNVDAAGNYMPGHGLLNFQTWAGGSSIDASIGGDMTTTGNLLLNYFCGNNTCINTGALGGIVYLGTTKIGNQTLTGTHSDAKLTVDGKIVAKSCYVTLSNWADYVFAKDYKLPNLYDIEKYYLINKHLPEIPSEKEVIENGIDIGEMNKVLLKKIEELTILMVNQQKEIDALKKK